MKKLIFVLATLVAGVLGQTTVLAAGDTTPTAQDVTNAEAAVATAKQAVTDAGTDPVKLAAAQANLAAASNTAAQLESNPVFGSTYADKAAANVSTAATSAAKAMDIAATPGFAASNPDVAAQVSSQVSTVFTNSAVADKAGTAVVAKAAEQIAFVVNVPAVANSSTAAAAVGTASTNLQTIVAASTDAGLATQVATAGAIAKSGSDITIVTLTNAVNPTVVSGAE